MGFIPSTEEDLLKEEIALNKQQLKEAKSISAKTHFAQLIRTAKAELKKRSFSAQ